MSLVESNTRPAIANDFDRLLTILPLFLSDNKTVSPTVPVSYRKSRRSNEG